MATRETQPCLTCDACGAKLSWPIVRGLTSKQDGKSEALYCPACRSPIERVNVAAIRP